VGRIPTTVGGVERAERAEREGAEEIKKLGGSRH